MDLGENGRARPDAGDGAALGLVPRLHGVRDVAARRACATTALIESTRQQVERALRAPGRATGASRDALFHALPYPRRLRRSGAPLVAYRASGLQRAVRRTRLHALLPARLRQAEALAPTLTLRSIASAGAGATPARGRAAAEGRDAARLRAARVLRRRQRRHGARCSRPTAARCWRRATRAAAAPSSCTPAARRRPCDRARRADRGARGDRRRPHRRQQRRLRLDDQGVRPPAGRRPRVGAGQRRWPRRRATSPRSWPSSARRPARCTRCRLRLAYHDACHLAHAQGVRDEPRAVLRAIPGVRAASRSRSPPSAAAAPASTTSSSREAAGRPRAPQGRQRARRSSPTRWRPPTRAA